MRAHGPGITLQVEDFPVGSGRRGFCRQRTIRPGSAPMTENEHASPNKRASIHATVTNNRTADDIYPAAAVWAAMEAQSAATGDQDHGSR
jgi:hypothetical protein